MAAEDGGKESTKTLTGDVLRQLLSRRSSPQHHVGSSGGSSGRENPWHFINHA
jgi:hypothetical protein